MAFALSLGILGGALLIATVSLTTRGPAIYVPYAAIVLASAVYLRLAISFWDGNPLENVAAASKIWGVLLRGRWMSKDEIDTRMKQIATR